MQTTAVKNNKLHIIAHIGANTLKDTVELATHAVKCGVKGVA